MELNLYYILFGILAFVLIYIILVLVTRNKNKNARQEWLDTLEYTSLRIDVPRNNDKSPLAAEQMFAALHGIFSDSSKFQYHLSFEIVARPKSIQFYIYVPKHLKDFVEGQIYAQYPTVEINEVADYAVEFNRAGINYAVCELGLNKPDVYPIKEFTDFEVDPISGITSVISKLGPEEQVWFQLLIRPTGDEWQEKGNKAIDKIKGKKGDPGIFGRLKSGFGGLFQQAIIDLFSPGKVVEKKEEMAAELPSTVQEALGHIEKKITKLGYETKVRILSTAGDPMTARMKAENMAASFKQFNTTNLNGFKITSTKINDVDEWHRYLLRSFEDDGYILNISEIASLYHFPHETVTTPNIVWSGAKKCEPPANLPTKDSTNPKELTVIGETNFRNTFAEFGIKLDDRRRHMYIVGKSGVGKSVLIENMAFDDINEGRGVIIVDPHGELADKVLACIPDDRVEDVVVFDPADREYPIAFNLLESVHDDFKGIVASGFVGIFKKIFGDSWGPRLEHILRNTVLALLDFPESTMLDIPRMLTGKRFREKVVAQVKDPVIRDFWLNEFEQYDSKFRTEAVSPILNKVGQFLASTTIRNIVGQSKSRINIREIMDQRKIMVVNLSRGKIGEDNSALLGAMMITKIQLAAMSRADVTVDQRPDCYLYVDEFQNFATESFAVILAEARKYNLNLTMAHQYIAQMQEPVRDAVFGNAGTIISFRVGGTDAEFLVKEFEPVFTANDLVNLEKFHIYIKLLIDGISSPAFSATTLPPIQKLTGNYERVISLSHQRYANLRSAVEEQIEQRATAEESELIKEAEAYKTGGLEALLTQRFDDKKEVPISYSNISKPVINENPAATKNTEPTPVVQATTVVEPKSDQTPASNNPAVIATTATLEPAQAISSVQNEAENLPKPKDDKPRLLRYQNIIGDKLYKERTARGGVKWYFGEALDREKLAEKEVIIDEKGEEMIRINQKLTNALQFDNSQGANHNQKSHNQPKNDNNTKVQNTIQEPQNQIGPSVVEQTSISETDKPADLPVPSNLALEKVEELPVLPVVENVEKVPTELKQTVLPQELEPQVPSALTQNVQSSQAVPTTNDNIQANGNSSQSLVEGQQVKIDQ